jgi:hypothetical protein
VKSRRRRPYSIIRPMLVIVALSLVASACGDDAAPDPTTTGAVATTGTAPGTTTAPVDTTAPTTTEAVDAISLPDFDSAAQPVDVSGVPDAGAAATAEMGPDGGVLEATAADGTVYTLSVPAGALVGPEQITMTPLTAVDGMPGELSAGGVLLEPEGLVFLASAELQVDLGEGASGSDLFSAATFADGVDLHLTSAAVDGETLVLDVPHFTLRLHGTGLEQLSDLLGTRVPGGAESWAREQEALIDEAFLGQIDSPSQYGFEMLRVLRGWLDRISDRFDFVLGDLGSDGADSRLDAALAEFLAWEGLAAMAQAKADDTDDGGFAALDTEARTLLSTTLRAAAAHAAAMCSLEHDIDQVARLHRFAAVAGALALPDGADFAEMARACGMFELRVDSTFTGREADIQLITGVEFRTVVQPTFEDYDGVEVPVSFRQFSINQAEADPDCSTTTRDGTARIRLDLNLNIRSPQPRVSQAVARITFPDPPTEVVRCSGIPRDFPIWNNVFSVAHGLIPDGFLVLTRVERGDVVAESVHDGEVVYPGEAEYAGTSEVLLVHVPE